MEELGLGVGKEFSTSGGGAVETEEGLQPK